LFPLRNQESHSTFNVRSLLGPRGGAASLAGIALLAVVLVFSGKWFFTSGIGTKPVEVVYETKTGEQSQVALDDGSVILLDTRSRARVRYDARERGVYLDRGQVFFTVARNQQLPFVVHAGQGQVRAVGTAFDIRREGDRVDVLVTEGVVQVSARGRATAAIDSSSSTPKAWPASTVELRSGGEASYTEVIEKTRYLQQENLERRTSWRHGKWMFRGETLTDMVEEISRYTDKKIEIVDPRIAGLRVGGYFDVGETDAVLAALQGSFGVRVHRVSDSHIQLSALDEPASD